jgi:hypothetical protein
MLFHNALPTANVIYHRMRVLTWTKMRKGSTATYFRYYTNTSNVSDGSRPLGREWKPGPPRCKAVLATKLGGTSVNRCSDTLTFILFDWSPSFLRRLVTLHV